MLYGFLKQKKKQIYEKDYCFYEKQNYLGRILIYNVSKNILDFSKSHIVLWYLKKNIYLRKVVWHYVNGF